MKKPMAELSRLLIFAFCPSCRCAGKQRTEHLFLIFLSIHSYVYIGGLDQLSMEFGCSVFLREGKQFNLIILAQVYVLCLFLVYMIYIQYPSPNEGISFLVPILISPRLTWSRCDLITCLVCSVP